MSLILVLRGMIWSGIITHLIRLHLICIFISHICSSSLSRFIAYESYGMTFAIWTASALIPSGDARRTDWVKLSISRPYRNLLLDDGLKQFSAAQGWCYINIILATGHFHFVIFNLTFPKIILVSVSISNFHVFTWVNSRVVHGLSR